MEKPFARANDWESTSREYTYILIATGIIVVTLVIIIAINLIKRYRDSRDLKVYQRHMDAKTPLILKDFQYPELLEHFPFDYDCFQWPFFITLNSWKALQAKSVEMNPIVKEAQFELNIESADLTVSKSQVNALSCLIVYEKELRDHLLNSLFAFLQKFNKDIGIDGDIALYQLSDLKDKIWLDSIVIEPPVKQEYSNTTFSFRVDWDEHPIEVVTRGSEILEISPV